LRIFNSSSDVIVKPLVDAKDIVFQQYDGNEVCRITDNRRLYFYDEGGEYISSSGSALTIASGGVAWELPTADGSANQVLKTDGSGNLDWVANSGSGGVDAANGSNDRVATFSDSDSLNGEANLTFDGSTLTVLGNAGVGIARTEGTLHVHTATAGSATAATNADDLVVENSAAGGISILTPDANDGILKFGSPTLDYNGSISVNHNSAAPYMDFNVNSARRMRIEADGDVQIESSGDLRIGNGMLEIDATGTYGNANMSQGTTINQASSSNEIMTFKSNDVAHSMTDRAEADTYAMFKKQADATGGLSLEVFTEGDTNFQLMSCVTSNITLKRFDGRSAIDLDVYKVSGSGIGANDSDANLCTIRESGRSRFIFDGEGSGHSEVEWTTYDEHDDIAMLHDIEATMVPDTFGAAMKYDADALTKAGILGKDSIHSEKPGTQRGMINFTKLAMLHHGAIRQVHQQLQDAKGFYEDKIAALESRLMRLEN